MSDTSSQAPFIPASNNTKVSLLRSLKAVAWSFIGIRKGKEYQKDLASVHPFHVIAVGLMAGVLFVLGLMVFVQWIVGA